MSGNSSPTQRLADFKNVVRSLMKDAEKVLGETAMLGDGEAFVEQIHLLGHYLDYTRRLCQDDRPGNQHSCSGQSAIKRTAATGEVRGPRRDHGSTFGLPGTEHLFM